MRYTCDDPAFAGDFVEFSDSWSRAQARATWAAWDAIPSGKVSEEEAAAAEERLLATLRPKIVALRLTCPDALPITEPADLTPARTEQMDMKLYLWWSNIWIVHLRELANLGNALGRQLYATSVASQAKALTETKKAQPVAHRSRRK